MSAVADGPVMNTAYLRLEEAPVPVGVVQVRHDVPGVEQHHQVLGQEPERVDLEVILGQKHRARLGDAETRPHDAHVDVVELRRAAHPVDRPVARHFRCGRADDLGVGESLDG